MAFARRLEDTNPDRIFIVQLGTQGIAPGTHFNPRHIAQADDRTILRCFQDNIAKLFFGMQAARALMEIRKSLSFGSGSAPS